MNTAQYYIVNRSCQDLFFRRRRGIPSPRASPFPMVIGREGTWDGNTWGDPDTGLPRAYPRSGTGCAEVSGNQGVFRKKPTARASTLPPRIGNRHLLLRMFPRAKDWPGIYRYIRWGEDLLGMACRIPLHGIDPVQQPIDGRTIPRTDADMMQANGSVRTDQDISATLVDVPFGLCHLPPLADLLHVRPPRFRAPDVPKRGGEHAIAPVRFPRIIDKKRPGERGILDITARKKTGFKCDHHDLHVPPAEFLFPVTQLRDVRAAGKSAEVAMKDHQEPTPLEVLETVSFSAAVLKSKRDGRFSGPIAHGLLPAHHASLVVTEYGLLRKRFRREFFSFYFSRRSRRSYTDSQDKAKITAAVFLCRFPLRCDAGMKRGNKEHAGTHNGTPLRHHRPGGSPNEKPGRGLCARPRRTARFLSRPPATSRSAPRRTSASCPAPPC